MPLPLQPIMCGVVSPVLRTSLFRGEGNRDSLTFTQKTGNASAIVSHYLMLRIHGFLYIVTREIAVDEASGISKSVIGLEI
jgi:hypothetical protein